MCAHVCIFVCTCEHVCSKARRITSRVIPKIASGSSPPPLRQLLSSILATNRSQGWVLKFKLQDFSSTYQMSHPTPWSAYPRLALIPTGQPAIINPSTNEKKAKALRGCLVQSHSMP